MFQEYNKLIKKQEFVHSVGQLLRLYWDARSAKHQNLEIHVSLRCTTISHQCAFRRLRLRHHECQRWFISCWRCTAFALFGLLL